MLNKHILPFQLHDICFESLGDHLEGEHRKTVASTPLPPTKYGFMLRKEIFWNTTGEGIAQGVLNYKGNTAFD